MPFIRMLVLMFAVASLSACGSFTTVNPPEPGELGPDPGAGSPE